ncbi:MAG: L-threonylcarbamoyladenylate synthase [Paludibacteraceae bacterium]
MKTNAKELQKESNPFSSDDLRQCLEALRNGGVILYPTDTVWGIGCDATNEVAVKRIYEIKQRADSKAMLVLVDSTARIMNYVDTVPDIAWDLAEISEKPLTIIYPQAKNIAENLLAADKSIGIRVTAEPFSKKLCEMLRRPIVSTSANIHGLLTPKYFCEIDSLIKERVDYIVQYRQNDETKSSPSSIIKVGVNGEVKIIRE